MQNRRLPTDAKGLSRLTERVNYSAAQLICGPLPLRRASRRAACQGVGFCSLTKGAVCLEATMAYLSK